MSDQLQKDAKETGKVAASSARKQSGPREELKSAVQTLPVAEQLAAIQPDRPLQFNLAGSSTPAVLMSETESTPASPAGGLPKNVLDMVVLLEQVTEKLEEHQEQSDPEAPKPVTFNKPMQDLLEVMQQVIDIIDEQEANLPGAREMIPTLQEGLEFINQSPDEPSFIDRFIEEATETMVTWKVPSK